MAPEAGGGQRKYQDDTMKQHREQGEGWRDASLGYVLGVKTGPN